MDFPLCVSARKKSINLGEILYTVTLSHFGECKTHCGLNKYQCNKKLPHVMIDNKLKLYLFFFEVENEFGQNIEIKPNFTVNYITSTN